MADANLKIPSEERIRFNASESIINAVSPRVDITTIPGGHRMRVTDIDGVETADIMDGVKGDTGDAAGFGTVSASVDANVGTPSVTVTSSGPNTAKNFDISFKNLKGVKGDTGDAAGFGTVSASVDANVGTPSVTVTSSGPNTAKNFDISFKNLKGNTGAAAGFDTPTASVDGYIGTPSVAVTATGPATAKKFDFAFHNLKGEKGDTGSIEDLIVDGTEPEEGAGVSVDGPISELSAEGWATQFSTTGKNLLEKSNRGVEGVSVKSAVGGEYTVNALNYDGSNGFRVTCITKTPTWAYIWIEIGDLRNTLATGDVDYTLSLKAKASQTFQSPIISITMDNGTNTQLTFDYVDFNSSSSVIEKTATTKGVEASGQNLQILLNNMPAGSTLDIADLMLELGSEATEYEPYTGGAPSPSPDYPQEIEVARGRNLANLTIHDMSKTGNSLVAFSTETDVTYDAVTLTFHLDSAVLRANDAAVVDYQKADGTHNYRTFPAYRSGSHPGTAYTGDFSRTERNITFSKLVIWCYTWTSGYLDVQLELGSTATPYVPYGHVGMEVQGKNLVSTNNGPFNDGASQTMSGVTFTRANNVITVVGTSSAMYPASQLVNASHWLEVGETYTLSVVTGKLPSNGLLYAVVYEADSTSASSISLASSRNISQVTFTVTRPYTYINVVTEGNGVTWSGQTISIQIEEGSTATEYEPYHHTTTPIPLPSRGWVGSLPDGTADILHLDGAGKVEWEKKTEEVHLGTIPAARCMFVSGTQYAIEMPANAKRIAPTSGSLIRSDYYSSHFGYRPERASIGDSILYDMSSSVIPRFYAVFDSDITSIAKAIQWLSDNDVTMLYPLATPTTESLGYIDLPDILAGSTVSIPELDALGISYYVDNGAVRKLVEQYKARLEATSFADIEDAVTELAAEVQQNTNRTQLYFGYDTVNGKQMISVFKRNV